MKKLICFIAVMTAALCGCSYNSGDPMQTVLQIDAAAEYFTVKTDEPLLVRYFQTTESGKRTEIPPQGVELYFEDDDLNRITLTRGNTFTFKESGKYSVGLRLIDELSVKGKLEARAYAPDRFKASEAKKLDGIEGVTAKGKEITAKGKDAAAVYDIIKSSGAAEFSFTASLDARRYYRPDAYENTLNLKYYTAVKILRNGKPVSASDKVRIFAVDEEQNKCADIFGNTAQSPGFKEADYSAVLGDVNGEVFQDAVPSKDIDSLYDADPARFTFGKEFKFLVLCEKAGRYEVIADAVIKEKSKKFASFAFLLEAADAKQTPENESITEIAEKT